MLPLWMNAQQGSTAATEAARGPSDRGPGCERVASTATSTACAQCKLRGSASFEVLLVESILGQLIIEYGDARACALITRVHYTVCAAHLARSPQLTHGYCISCPPRPRSDRAGFRTRLPHDVRPDNAHRRHPGHATRHADSQRVQSRQRRHRGTVL